MVINGDVGNLYQINSVVGNVNINQPSQAVFYPAHDYLLREISHNFLHEFNGVESDYKELLSEHFRRIFFKFFNDYLAKGQTNYLVIWGREGSGKTFNTLLVSLHLQQEGYNVFYCPDIKCKELTIQYLFDLGKKSDRKSIFIIDNCHTDIAKTQELFDRVARTSRISSKTRKLINQIYLQEDLRADVHELVDVINLYDCINWQVRNLVKLLQSDPNISKEAEQLVKQITLDDCINKPKYIFLSRPLEEKEAVKDTFGDNPPIIFMQEAFIDLKNLVRMFFNKIDIGNNVEEFIQSLQDNILANSFYEYRNMAFWNEILKAIQANDELNLSENQIYKRGYRYFQKHEPQFLKFPSTIAHLLAFFSQGLSVNREYVLNILSLPPAELRELESSGIIEERPEDWVTHEYRDDSSLFYISDIHPTKAKILLLLLAKYYQTQVDVYEEIIRYAENYPENLYYITSQVYGYGELRALNRNDRLLTIAKNYINHRKLGKKWDRFVSRLIWMSSQEREFLFDNEVLDNLANKINDPANYLVHKFCAFRAVYRIAPEKAYEVFQRLTPNALIQTFLNDKEDLGITSFAKWMEALKNMYEFSEGPEKEKIKQFTIEVLDACSEEFIRRFDNRDIYFTQLHWLLKRLMKIGLANYFLAKISPDKLIEFIKKKDINTVELSRSVLAVAKQTQYYDQNNTQNSYYRMIREILTYDDIKRIFNNYRSHLNDIVMNAGHDFVSSALVRYVDEPNFREKVNQSNDALIEISVSFIRKNIFLSDTEKEKIITAIIQSSH